MKLIYSVLMSTSQLAVFLFSRSCKNGVLLFHDLCTECQCFCDNHIKLVKKKLRGIFSFDVVISLKISHKTTSERTRMDNNEDWWSSVFWRTKSTKQKHNLRNYPTQWSTNWIQTFYQTTGSHIHNSHHFDFYCLWSFRCTLLIYIFEFKIFFHAKKFPHERRSNNTKDNLVSWTRV